ncbi:MFS transporter [Thermodesulfobacteriota bacterium]
MDPEMKVNISFYGWKNVTVGVILGFSMALVFYTFTLFLPFWVDEFGWSRQNISYAATLWSIIMGLNYIFVGHFIAKYGSRRAIVIGVLITISGLLVLSFQSNIWLVYLGHGILVGIGVSLGSNFAITTMVNNWFNKKRSLALSMTTSSMALGGMILVPVLMKFIDVIGWRSAYLISAAIIFTTGIIVAGLFIRNKPEDMGQVPDGIVNPGQEKIEIPTPVLNIYRTPVEFTAKEAFRTPTIWFLMIFYVLFMFAANAKIVHAAAFFLDVGISKGQVGFVVGLASGIMVFSQLVTGILGLKIEMHRLAILGFILVVIGMIILVYANSLTMILIYTFFTYIGTGINMLAMMNLLANYYGAENFPVILGYFAPCWSLPASLGAPFAGYIRDTTGSYIPAWKIFIALLIIALVFLILAKPPKHPSLIANRGS